MRRTNGIFIVVIAVIIVGMFAVSPASAELMKIGYVDLRRAFYEYKKSKNFDEALTTLTNQRGETRKTIDRKSTRLNSSHTDISRMPSSA